VTPEPYIHRLRVRYQEVDYQQIVYNSRYLEYVDTAMTDWFRWLGWDYPELIAMDCDPSLVTMTIDWHKPAVFDEELDIVVELERVGTKSYTLAYEIRRVTDGDRLVTARAVYVNFDLTTKQSRPLPEAVRDRMTPHITKELVPDGSG
jgi:acyl-CoA thioester hydrolase